MFGFASYLTGFLSYSYQTTKRHSYDVQSSYKPNLSLFSSGVYPVGVSNLLSFFTRIIAYNSKNLWTISTKFGTYIRLSTPYTCTKFQLNTSMRLRVIAIFVVCAKRRRIRKNELKQRNFGRSYLGNGWTDLLQIWNVTFPTWRAYPQQVSYLSN